MISLVGIDSVDKREIDNWVINRTSFTSYLQLTYLTSYFVSILSN